MDGFAAAMVGEESIFLGYGIDDQFSFLVIRNLIARREADASKRRCFHGVSTLFLSCRKTDFHTTLIQRNDVTKAE